VTQYRRDLHMIYPEVIEAGNSVIPLKLKDIQKLLE
jgi:hypothetical protein